jgi:hypothetical protein
VARQRGLTDRISKVIAQASVNANGASEVRLGLGGRIIDAVANARAATLESVAEPEPVARLMDECATLALLARAARHGGVQQDDAVVDGAAGVAYRESGVPVQAGIVESVG